MKLKKLLFFLAALASGWTVFSAQISLQPAHRLSTGPYRVSEITASGWAATTGKMNLRLKEDPTYLGGIEYHNDVTGLKETLRRFKIVCPDSSVWFDDVQFQYDEVDGDSIWVGVIDSTNGRGRMIGGGINQFDLSSLSVQSCYCEKSYDEYSIWNGYRFAVALTTDDGEDYNNAVADTAAALGVNYTLFVPPLELGGTGTLTESEFQGIVAAGNEAGTHGMSSGAVMTMYRHNQPYDMPNYTAHLSPTGFATTNTFNDSRVPTESNDYRNVWEPGEGKGNTWTFNAEWSRGTKNHFLTWGSVADTSRGTIDSVRVFSYVKYKQGSGGGTVLTDIRFAASSPVGTVWNDAELTPATGWSTYATTLDQNPYSSTDWTWAGLDTMNFGMRATLLDTSATGVVDSLWISQMGTTVYYNPSLQWDVFSDGSPDTLLSWHVTDAKRMMEDIIRPHVNDFVVKGLALPLSNQDGRVRGVISESYEYARIGTRGDTAEVVGDRDNSPYWLSWHNLQPYDLGMNYGISTFTGSGASFSLSEVDSAVSAVLTTMRAATTEARRGGTLPISNQLLIVLTHRETEATHAQVGQLIRSFQAAGDVWIAPLGEIIDYWKRANMQRRLYREPG